MLICFTKTGAADGFGVGCRELQAVQMILLLLAMVSGQTGTAVGFGVGCGEWQTIQMILLLVSMVSVQTGSAAGFGVGCGELQADQSRSGRPETEGGEVRTLGL